MDAVDFLKEAVRMHNFDDHDCVECEIYKHSNGNLSCVNWVLSHPDEAVKVVEQWAKEHPRKTRQEKFLEMFPETPISEGVLEIYPCKLVGSKLNSEECHSYDEFGFSGCYECRKNYWLKEVE